MSSFAPAPVEPQSTHWRGRIGLAAMTAARFALGLGMMPYGISKLLDLQFQVGASTYAQPLGVAAGSTLTWAFLGYSPVFQVLLGAFETIPAFLLFFARTRRLGALLLFPVLLNVALINYFLDLWPSTQLISLVLLALNIFLLLYDLPMYLGFLSRLLIQPEPIANRKFRISAKVASFVIPVALLAAFGVFFRSQIAEHLDPVTDFIGRRQINRAGSWTIVSYRVGERPIPAAEGASLYFDFDNRCVFDDGVRRERGKYAASHASRTFKIEGIQWQGAGYTMEGVYQAKGNQLFLNGRIGEDAVSLVLRKHRWGNQRK